jgi:hypothetical protein
MWAACADAPADLQPIHPRQVQIEHDQVVVVDLGQLDALLAVKGDVDGIALRAERAHE